MSIFPFAPRSATRMLAALSLAFVAAACDDDDPVAVEPEPTTTTIVLTIAGAGVANQTLTWTTANGAVTPSAITLPVSATRTVTAQFRRADGSADPVVTAADFRLDFKVSSGNSVTITKNGTLGATITTGSSAGNTVLTMELVHVEENHSEYTSSAVTFQVTP